MSRRNRLNAVATTALVAAFPVFPLFADEPTAPSAPEAQAVAAEATPAPNVNEAFAEFDVSLFEIPDDRDAQFYRKRLAEIDLAWFRLSESFEAKQRAWARKNRPNKRIETNELIVNAPLGKIYDGKTFVSAPADSVPARRAVALADLYERLSNDPTLPLEVRGVYFQRWLGAKTNLRPKMSRKEFFDFYSQLLDEAQKTSPLDLPRVFYLSSVLTRREQIVATAEPTPPLDRAAVEKLLDVPEGENSEFYAERRSELSAALGFVQKEKDAELEARVREARKAVSELQDKAIKAEIAAFDRDAVKPLFDVPTGESAAFYLERYKETEAAYRQVAKYAQNIEPRDLREIAARLRTQTLPEISKRLAYADELEPLERFEHLQRSLRYLDVDELRDALDVERARNATSPIDSCRAAYVQTALASRRIDAAVAETRKSLPESERFTYSSSDDPEVSAEARAMFDAARAEVAELADDGAIPWLIGLAYSEWAENIALSLENKCYIDIATQLRKDIRDALADSENETDRRVLRNLEREIRAGEIIGSELPVAGLNNDGTPFDWASYRGAPVLLVAGPIEPSWANYDNAYLPKCVEAGLKIVFYRSNVEDAKLREKSWREDFEKRQYLSPQGLDLERRTPIDAFIAPVGGRGIGDWPYEHGIIWTEFAVLFDAEGRVLATSPSPLPSARSRKIGDELKRLFPEIPVAERK
ncbi:MAG: hypothetical protein IKU86_05295 [Thermoguttaceae bacterium]|nr:hypothetical protein [Thermoguttaceae bacterium]